MSAVYGLITWFFFLGGGVGGSGSVAVYLCSTMTYFFSRIVVHSFNLWIPL